MDTRQFFPLFFIGGFPQVLLALQDFLIFPAKFFLQVFPKSVPQKFSQVFLQVCPVFLAFPKFYWFSASFFEVFIVFQVLKENVLKDGCPLRKEEEYILRNLGETADRKRNWGLKGNCRRNMKQTGIHLRKECLKSDWNWKGNQKELKTN